MNFEGAFLCLHAISPVLFILCYVLICKESEEKMIKKLLTTPILMLAYLLFVIYSEISGGVLSTVFLHRKKSV